MGEAAPHLLPLKKLESTRGADYEECESLT
jgi:hypothetical protein